MRLGWGEPAGARRHGLALSAWGRRGAEGFCPFDGGRLELSGVFGGSPSLASNSATRAVKAATCAVSASTCAISALDKRILLSVRKTRKVWNRRHRPRDFRFALNAPEPSTLPSLFAASVASSQRGGLSNYRFVNRATIFNICSSCSTILQENLNTRLFFRFFMSASTPRARKSLRRSSLVSELSSALTFSELKLFSPESSFSTSRTVNHAPQFCLQ